MSTSQHTYPPLYRPGQSWALDEAWAILDTLTPGAIPEDIRTLLTGMIWSTLIRLAREGRIATPTEASMTPTPTPGQVAHAAFIAAIEAASAWVPPFEALAPVYQRAWEAAAQAVLAQETP